MPSFVVEESLNSVKVFWLKQDKLLAELQKVAVRIGKEDKNVKKIILFGSLAEKRGVPGSDADLLILLEKDDRPFMERIVEWTGKFSLDFPTEVFPFTVQESSNPIVLAAVENGIVLFERGR